MTDREYFLAASRRIKRDGPDATIAHRVGGRPGRDGKKRLFFKRGPVGEVIQSDHDSVVVRFSCQEILKYFEMKLPKNFLDAWRREL